MRMMQKTMLNGKPQKALCASTAVFKDINYSWKKKYSWNNLEYIPLYLGAAARMAVPESPLLPYQQDGLMIVLD